MQFETKVSIGNIITIVSMVLLTGVSWGAFTSKVESVDQRVEAIASSELRLEQRMDIKLNQIDQRTQRIESLLMQRQ